MIPLQIPPGVVRNSTEYATGGRWYDSNWVRFIAGQARPIGGWAKATASALTGKCRALLAWRTNASVKWLAIGTSQKLYATKLNGTVTDITPAGFTAGSDDIVDGAGYGVGEYGAGLYGTARTTAVVQPLSVWHLDTWGEYLVGCMRGDGKLYEWTLNTANPAAVISNAPTGCIGVMVTEQRHMMALGAGSNPRKIQWSHKENNTSWTPGPLTEAGSFELQTSGVIQRGLRVRGQNLILTDTDAHVVTHVGYPLVYGRERVGTDCGVIGPCAAATVESFCAWMGQQGFWIYEGSGVRPLPSDVQDYVFSRINRQAAAKTVSGHNGTVGELWWFYPAGNNTEPSAYVIWNYRDNVWSIGELARTAWIDAGAFPYPYAAGTDNHIYRHEDTMLDDGATRAGDIYLRSGAIDFKNGSDVFHIRKILPDEKQAGAVNVTFHTRYSPMGDETIKGPYTIRADGYTDCRFSGRQLSIKITSADDSDWRVGKFRLEGTIGGKR